MNDEQKTPADDDQPADTTPTDDHTVEQPATTEQAPTEQATSSPKRTRNTLIAGGAGLALACGLVGFGIGHASADGGDGDRFRQTSRSVPGEGRPDFHGGDRPGRSHDGDHRRQLQNGDSGDQPSSES